MRRRQRPFYSTWRSAPRQIESLAVLLLENLSGDSAQDYFADAMTEALIIDLSKIGTLKVIPRSVVKSYKEQRKPHAEIARDLEVERYFIACAYAPMKKPERAIWWLEHAARNGFPCYPLFERDPNLDSVRQDIRFAKFIAKIKEEWEHYQVTLFAAHR
jgi:hypothetical protein